MERARGEGCDADEPVVEEFFEFFFWFWVRVVYWVDATFQYPTDPYPTESSVLRVLASWIGIGDSSDWAC